MQGLDAVIFDMDGVLVDSEPIWRAAERARFAEVGRPLTEEDATSTMGMRVDEVVDHWFARQPWPDPDHPALIGRILDTVVEMITAGAEPLPGVVDAVRACEKHGLRLAVASSSWTRVIDAALSRLEIAAAFEVVCSAESEPYGKPHPGVFLTTATQLGVDPTRCLVVEDSVNGMVAALAARMRVVVVPERWNPRFAAADHAIESLVDFPDLLGCLIGQL